MLTCGHRSAKLHSPGALNDITMRRLATAADLKSEIRRLIGPPVRRQRLIFNDTVVPDSTPLRQIATAIWPWWCIIDDVATVQPGIPVQLELTLILESCFCILCGKTELRMQLCCGSVHYCGMECQVSDWRVHKQLCLRR